MGAIIFFTGVFVIVAIFALSVFGAGIIVLEGKGVRDSIRGAAGFLKSRPRAFAGYSFLLFSYLFITFFLLLLAYPFRLIPIIGTLIVPLVSPAAMVRVPEEGV